MEIAKVYPLDAVYDTPEDVPEDVKANKRYAGASNWTVKEVAETVKNDFGSIDILVHSLANGPEVELPSKSLYFLFHCHHQEHLVDLFFYYHKGNKTTAGDIKERIPCCNFSI